MSWFVLFAAVVFGLYFWRQYRDRQMELNSPLADHRLGLRYIGEIIVLERGLPDGAGSIRLGNRDWNVRGPKLPAGSKVRVIGVDDTVLLVDRIGRS